MTEDFLTKSSEIFKDSNNKDDLEKYIKLEIGKIIIDNLMLFSFNDSKLILLKNYCRENIDKTITSTPSNLLMMFTREALRDLIDTEILYDFRDIE